MHRNQSVNVHSLAMVPRSDVPRTAMALETAYKTTYDSGYLVPFFCEEVLPGDSWSVQMTAMTRLATPIFPIMDNLYFETFFFYVPNRLVWQNWRPFMGEQFSPSSSINFLVPKTTSPVGGYAINSLQDYFGLPTVGQVGAGNTVTHNALPIRMYNLIYNEWFRDENLQNGANVDLNDGPDNPANYTLRRRGKRKDIFTGALPWTQKGGTPVSLPLGTSAPVVTTGDGRPTFNYGAASNQNLFATINVVNPPILGSATSGAGGPFPLSWSATKLVADLTAATAATVNQVRQAFQIQRFLERDARGGTRYTELLQAHFGVRSPDARLQRPEYLGGGSTPISINPVAQTSRSEAGNTPLGTLAAFGTMVGRHGFSQSFVEHGYIIGLMNVRADLSYQQGLRRHWFRDTRFDFYWPVFQALGEQPVYNKEIFCDGSGNDGSVFGYQERWAEYRYLPPQITGLMRSTAAGTLDPWHLAQKFLALPTLGDTFIQDTPPLDRILAVSSQTGKQLILDSFIKARVVRPMPLYSVPGSLDHF